MAHIHDKQVEKMEEIANDIREDIIKMLVAAGSGHSAGPLGLADVFTALYFHVLHHKPKQPLWEGRDRLILSAGHLCPVRYAAMARAGYFPISELKTLRKLGTRLQGHPERPRFPALESTSGPLGEGLPQAAGLAYAATMDKKTWNVYCVMGDGELEEGIVWESLLFAGKNALRNLIVIVDRNNIQIDGYTEDVMPLEPLRAKFEAFNFHVLEINGNDIRAVIDACNEAKTIYEKPKVIIAHTIPGRGIDYMEFDYRWHGDPPGNRMTEKTPPKEDQAAVALKELRTLGGKIRSEHE
ncbi:MAG: transketolase [bacterium]